MKLEWPSCVSQGQIFTLNFLPMMARCPWLSLSQHHTHTLQEILKTDYIGTHTHTTHTMFTRNPPPTFITQSQIQRKPFTSLEKYIEFSLKKNTLYCWHLQLEMCMSRVGSGWGDFLTQPIMVGPKKIQPNPTHHIISTQPTWVELNP